MMLGVVAWCLGVLGGRELGAASARGKADAGPSFEEIHRAYWEQVAAQAAAADAGNIFTGVPLRGSDGGVQLYFQGTASEAWGTVSGSGEIWVNPKLSELGQQCVRYQLQAWLPKCAPWRPWTPAP